MYNPLRRVYSCVDAFVRDVKENGLILRYDRNMPTVEQIAEGMRPVPESQLKLPRTFGRTMRLMLEQDRRDVPSR